MPGQTTYNQYMGEGFPGMVADNGPSEIVSAVADETIPFGYAVVVGASVGSCKLSDTNTDYILGIAAHAHKQPSSAGTAAYSANDVVNIVRKGRVWVPCATASTNGAPAYIVATTGQITNSSTGNQQIGVFRKTISDAGNTVVEVNLP